MGDVLAGLAGSLIAQQPGQEQTAFYAAVLLHSAAADRAALEIGMRGLTASAVVPKVEALLYQAPDCVQ
jgi:NAD(P)H-hydrate epimerase